jgi:hypothetical protein
MWLKYQIRQTRFEVNDVFRPVDVRTLVGGEADQSSFTSQEMLTRREQRIRPAAGKQGAASKTRGTDCPAEITA